MLIIGDSGVGKTSILRRFADDAFLDHCPISVGVEFKVRSLEDDGQVIKLQIWDPSHLRHNPSYFKEVHGILIVFDITDHFSFEDLESWFSLITSNNHALTTQILVGNKSDLSTKRAVATERALDFAATKQIPFLEVSAKDGTNVESTFKAMVRMMTPPLHTTGSNPPEHLAAR